MNIMQAFDSQGNLTWVEATPRRINELKESVAPSKLPTVEQMFENRPSLTSLLSKRPAHLCSERDGFMDTLPFSGLTFGMILVGVMLFNQYIPCVYISFNLLNRH